MATQTAYALVGTVEFECEDLLGVYQTEVDARQAFVEYQDRVFLDREHEMTEYQDYYIRPLVLGASAETPQLAYVYPR